MEYQALYRKYRPRTFSDVVGQDIIVKTLINSIKSNKISHSYLFSGPRGTGKTTIAKIFSRSINCEHPINDADPCDKCDSCNFSNYKECPDIIELDAASNNKVDDIRTLIENVEQVSTMLKYKVYIIDEVHMLSNSAFNALLKTIEEPPSNVIFILATTELNKVPITIVSRCQTFTFKRIPDSLMFDQIKNICKKEKVKIDDEVVNKICNYSDGCLRDALSLLDKLISYGNNNISINELNSVNGLLNDDDLIDFLNDISEGNINNIVVKLNNYYNEGKNILTLTQDLINTLENEYIRSIINKENTKYSNLNKLLMYLTESLTEIKVSYNPKLILELKLLKYIDEEKIKDISVKIDGELNKNDLVEQKNEEEEPKIISREIISEPKEVKNISTEVISEENNEKLDDLKKIRINNTFATASKAIKNELSNKWSNIADYTFNKKYGYVSSLLADCSIAAAGEKNIIIVTKTKSVSNKINENLGVISELFEDLYKSKYDIIALDSQEWLKEAEDYKSNYKTKKYEYIPEGEVKPVKMTRKTSKSEQVDDTLTSIFGSESIKYE